MQVLERTQSGLFRTATCAPSATMAEVFESLKMKALASGDNGSPVIGHFGGKVALEGGTPEDGWELIEFPGKGYLVVCDCTFPQERSEVVPYEGLTELHFTLSGQVAFSGHGSQQRAIDGQAGESQADADDLKIVACRVGQDAVYRVTCKEGRRRSVGLYLHDSFLEQLLDASNPELTGLFRELSGIGRSDVYVKTLPISRSLFELVQQIIRNPYSGQRRLIYSEAKCVELLCETFDLLRAHSSARELKAMRPRDIEVLERAQHLLCSDLEDTPDIRQLARILGTNANKLSKGFRTLYGTTIHQFTLNEKMRKALEMLVQQRASVGEAASAVGYQHQSSFTLAFTRHFGFPPSLAHEIAPSGEIENGRAKVLKS